MDVNAIKAIWDHCLLVGCGVAAVGYALFVAWHGLIYAHCRARHMVKRIGLTTVAVLLGFAVWATYTGSPTQEEKEDAIERERGEAQTNAMFGAMLLGFSGHVVGQHESHGNQTNDTDGVDAPTYGLMSAYVPPEIGGLTGDWDVFSVTNVYFSSFSKSGDIACAEITIGEHGVAYGETIRVYIADKLRHPAWTNVYEHDYQNESSLTLQFDMSQFPTSFLYSAFFGLDYPQDSDGDGIADGDERYRYNSNPAKYDTDDDGLGDGDELRIGSSLISADTDGDGLTDAEELGGSSVMSASQMFLLDTSSCTELSLGGGGSYRNWDVSIPGGVSLAAAEYSACNISLYGRVSFADSAVFVETCGQWMYAYPSWGSKVLYGSVVTNDTEYFVVEYRNISSDASGVAKLTCQVIIPKAMRNAVYVSYREVDEGLDDPLYPLGVTCSDKPSPFDPQSEYSILPPVGHRVPVANTTIKYIIGLGSDPTVYNRYEEPVLPPASNSNAYYTVDIVADDHAHIVFTGDGLSDLPDPDFWALPGDTNRVMLLIGKNYEIKASSSFVVQAYSDPDVVLSNVSAVVKRVVSPVLIECVPPVSGRLMASVAGGFSMNVYPSYLGGLFYWTNSCCQITASGNYFSWMCSGCGCGGCNAQGYYRYEGYDIPCLGIPCGCAPAPGPNDVSSRLWIPHTLFANDDDDNSDGVVDFGHNYAVADDDIVSAEVHFRNGSECDGSVTLTVSDSFIGNIVSSGQEHSLVGRSMTWDVSAGETINTSVLLDPQTNSVAYNDCEVRLDWSLENGMLGSQTQQLTVVEAVAEPICNETKNVIIDDAVHHLTYNPCGVVVGKDAYFKVDVEPSSYPNSLIKWSVDATSIGEVTFPRGNTGREVKVHGVTEGSVLLNVQVGDCQSISPRFPLNVVTNSTVDIYFTVLEENGVPVKNEAEIREMVKRVNDIYSQIGYTFDIRAIVQTNLSCACSVNEYGNDMGRWSVSNLTSEISCSNGLKCIFVNEIISAKRGKRINGVNWKRGMVLSSACAGDVLAHEIGHMFGLVDIYAECEDFDLGEESFTGLCSPMDWNGGSYGPNNHSPRYYRSGTSCKDVITRLLMHGFTGDVVNNDMTIGSVAGLINDESNEGQFLVGFADIGFLMMARCCKFSYMNEV